MGSQSDGVAQVTEKRELEGLETAAAAGKLARQEKMAESQSTPKLKMELGAL